MSRLDELIRELCPDGMEYKTIASVSTFEQPTPYIVSSTKYDDGYPTPVLTAGQSFVLGYTNETNGIYRASKLNPVIIFDDFTGAFKWVDFDFKVKSSAMKFIKADESFIMIRYLYHIMGNIGFASNEHKRLWISTYSTFEIPVPPLEVQREIVRILDNFTELTVELTAELTARKKQYEFYRDNLLTFDNTSKNIIWKTLGEICTLKAGKSISSDNISPVKTDYYSIPCFGGNGLRGYVQYSNQEGAKSIIGRQGALCGNVCYATEDFYATEHAVVVTNNGCFNDRFLYHLLKNKNLNQYKTAGAQPGLSVSKLETIVIPIPTIDVQNKVAYVLDNFDAICSDLNIGLPAEIEARQKQYEFYRDALLTYAATGKTILTDRQTDRQTDKTRQGLIKLMQYVFGFVMISLNDICWSISAGKANTKYDTGKFPVYGSTGIIARTDKAVYNKTNILIARVGANAGYTHIACGDYDVSDNTLIVDVKEEYNLKYVYYQLVNFRLNRYAKGGGQPLITASQIKEVSIPLPSMEEQNRIVSILDRFDTLCNDLTDGLPAEIEARQKQYEYYRDKLLTFK